MGEKAASPSPAVSSAKVKRLDALHRRLSRKRAGAAQCPGGPSAGPASKKHKASTACAPPSPGRRGPAAFPYEPLDHVRFDATLARRLQASAHKDATAVFLNGLKTSAATESAAVQIIQQQKVQDRVLQLDNPAAIKGAKAQRWQGPGMSAAPRVGSAAVARARVKELSRLPVDQQRYELYQPLNVLWRAYAGKLMHSPNLEDDLLQADLHGCQLTVLASKVARHVGKQAIVVQDRGNVLVAITPDNQQLLLAKRGSKFRVQLDALHAMEVSGDAIVRS